MGRESKILVTIMHDREVLTHIAFTDLGFATLCGMDGNDPGIGMTTVETPAGAKVDCEQCLSIWREAKLWKASDFRT